MVRGVPGYIRSDNGPEFIAAAIKKWLSKSGVETLYIEPGSPWENGYIPPDANLPSLFYLRRQDIVNHTAVKK